jgi:hypothetical protein
VIKENNEWIDSIENLTPSTLPQIRPLNRPSKSSPKGFMQIINGGYIYELQNRRNKCVDTGVGKNHIIVAAIDFTSDAETDSR